MSPILKDLLAAPLRLGGHIAASPIRMLGRFREPAVAEPWLLSPGDPPPTDGRILLLFDGGCGICLHARDVFGALDRRNRLAFDRIARHDSGLLRDIPDVARYEAWHVVRPDGRILDGAAGLAAAISALPGGGPIAWLMRRNPELSDRFYAWFATNRGWISRGSGLINHPQRDPREQLTNPGHAEVIAALAHPPG